MSLRCFAYAIPLSLGLWLAIVGASLLTWAWFDTLAEQSGLDRDHPAERQPFLPNIPPKGTP